MPSNSFERQTALKSVILPVLEENGYAPREQVEVSRTVGDNTYTADVLIEDADGHRMLVALKWQQAPDAAEEDVPFDAICLGQVVRSSGGKYEKGYLVLGGDGWTSSLRNYYLSDRFAQQLADSDIVAVVSLDDFTRLANKRQL